jgi:hypothetical protein
MSTPTPEPTPQTVVDEVHQVLDTAKTAAQAAIAAVEHLDFGTLAGEAKQVLHDGIELIKQRVSNLFHGAAPVATQGTPPTGPPAG